MSLIRVGNDLMTINNLWRMGDWECAVSLIDAIDCVTSDGTNDIQQAVNSVLVALGFELDDATWNSPQPYGDPVIQIESTVSSMSLNNFKVYRNTAGGANTTILTLNPGAALKTLHLNGVSADDEQGQSYAAVTLIQGTGISVDVENVDPTHISALASSGDLSTMTSVYGSGLAATGWQIPDANVPNLVPYISVTGANAGKFCIKYGGTPSCL